jgi:DNA repair protein RadC
MMQLYLREKISSLPLKERPREKLCFQGVTSLSDAELLAILIGAGTRKAGVEKLSSAVLDYIDRAKDDISVPSLIEIPGIGKAKATLILASLEFSRRRLCPEHKKIGFPADVLLWCPIIPTENRSIFSVSP